MSAEPTPTPFLAERALAAQSRLRLKGGREWRDANRALADAAQDGDSNAALEALSRGADPETRAPGGWSVLMWCASRGKIDAIRALAACGADVSAPDAKGLANPMTAAAMRGSAAGVEELARLGADPALGCGRSAGGPPSRSPLSWACGSGHGPAVAALLAAGADPNAPGVGGATPLMEAARRGQDVVVDLLLASGARLDARDISGSTAEQLARAAHRPDMAKKLADIATSRQDAREISKAIGAARSTPRPSRSL